jgi:hypothetical protein
VKLTADRHPDGVRRYQHLRPAARRADRCGAACPGESWLCTLDRDHRGPHVSHSRLRRVLAVWDAPRGARDVSRRRRKRHPPTGLPVRTPPNLLDAIGDLAWRIVSSAEEIALVVFFLAFVWFAFDWLRLIFGG